MHKLDLATVVQQLVTDYGSGPVHERIYTPFTRPETLLPRDPGLIAVSYRIEFGAPPIVVSWWGPVSPEERRPSACLQLIFGTKSLRWIGYSLMDADARLATNPTDTTPQTTIADALEKLAAFRLDVERDLSGSPNFPSPALIEGWDLEHY